MANPVRFAFKQQSSGEFIFELNDDAKIAHARRVLAGEETSKVHVGGRIKIAKASYNPDWSFHLVPETIAFFDVAMEVSDADMNYVEEHLDEVGGAFLPGYRWTPWSSRLVREVS